MDANIVRRIVSHGRVVGTAVDTQLVGSFICTKSMGSDAAENLTLAYKCLQSESDDLFRWCRLDELLLLTAFYLSVFFSGWLFLERRQ